MNVFSILRLHVSVLNVHAAQVMASLDRSAFSLNTSYAVNAYGALGWTGNDGLH